uniref:NAC family transcription factor n=1 Tax=Melilotus albus TaxID=47082 RepID=A0A896W375_MELAB|nr:NAC family transcription factor [Melilotus albus]
MALNCRSNNNITPSDDELLRSFLYNKIHNKLVPNYITVLELDLFGTEKNPWKIWEDFSANSYCERDIYFFTTLKKKSATSKRWIRTIGIGTWEGEDTGTSIFAKKTKQLLGVKKRYRFEKSGTSEDGRWILHEYSLDKSLIHNASGNTVPRKYIIHEEPKIQSNGEHKRKKVVNSESEYKGKKEECMGNICPEETIVLGLKAPTKPVSIICVNNIWLGENIEQNSRNQLDSGNIKNKVVKSTNPTEAKFNKEDGDHIISEEEEEEEDGGDNMPWAERFSWQLRETNKGSLIEEEDVQMLPNNFYKDLLLENISFK